MASRLGLRPGQKLCCNCKSKALADDVGECGVTDDDSDVDFETQEQTVKLFNEHLEYLQCSPIKAGVAESRKVAYGKRKLEQIHNAVEAKCAKALDISPELLGAKLCEKCDDLERFKILLREKISKAETPKEKIKLLTLTPESYTIEKTTKEFNVTTFMVKQARKLKEERGILAEPADKKGRCLAQTTIDRVREFFESDEFSRMCPGIKECVAIRNEKGEKVSKQKRLLLTNIREMYVEYKHRYPEDKIGFSKFCELRPRWCVTVTAPGSQSVCVCQQHQNAKLLVTSLPNTNMHYTELLSLAVCDLANRDCMLGACLNCPGPTAINNFVTELFETNGFVLEDEIRYKQWGKMNNRCTILSLTTSVEEFISTVTSVFKSLRAHHYTAKAQAAYLSDRKENLGEGEVIILLDFAENYSFVVQDAVQAFHWNNTQATLHPFVLYYRASGKLEHLNACIVSDCLKHDTIAVHAFITSLMPHLKTKLPQMSKVMYYSDGCSGQYKNYKNFLNLCHHQSDYLVDAEWHFFATSHGKSPCDGIGGTVKRLVARASLQATTSDHILSPLEMYNWLTKHIPGITFQYVTEADVASNAVKFELAARFAAGKTVPGTRSNHAFIPMARDALKMKRLSCDNEFITAEF